ncbi:MAG: hypothetical protein JNN07_19245 [Verrucomicrobiales bacterium]|nr:hypothetical protein [Verrucomicrobiales bacterium]
MNCARVEQLMLLQETLPGPAVEHQLTCPRCQALTLQLQSLDQSLRSALSTPALPSDFESRLMMRLESLAARQRRAISREELMAEDARHWNQFSGYSGQQIRRVGLESLASVTLVTLVLMGISARFDALLPTGLLVESIPLTAPQVASFLGWVTLCGISAVWSTWRFRQQT